MGKTYAEAYVMRSRHYQLLGRIGELMADAFMEADKENQENIGRNTLEAMTHYLVEQRGYSREEINRALGTAGCPNPGHCPDTLAGIPCRGPCAPK